MQPIHGPWPWWNEAHFHGQTGINALNSQLCYTTCIKFFHVELRGRIKMDGTMNNKIMNLTVKAERGTIIWNLLYMHCKDNKVVNLISTLGVSSHQRHRLPPEDWQRLVQSDTSCDMQLHDTSRSGGMEYSCWEKQTYSDARIKKLGVSSRLAEELIAYIDVEIKLIVTRTAEASAMTLIQRGHRPIKISRKVHN